MNYKKGISMGIALSLVVGSSASAITPEDIATIKDGKLMTLEKQIAEESNLKSLQGSDRVRIIVELNGDAVIEKAAAENKKISEMDISQVKKYQKSILKEQDSIQRKISSKGIDCKVINSFTNIANGFSMETTLEKAMEIQELEGVKSVTVANEYERPEPLMNNSGEITETQPAWDSGYKGQGTVISIIDTGIDSGHKDMVLSDKKEAELDKSEVEAISKKNGLPGKFYTDKVPYGYNYMDGNEEIRDLGPGANMHGMHVAGISGANGDTKNGGIKGTAPEAQLLAMKVFGNNPAMSSTFGDVIIKAIDDSVKLGADVINMSLGSTASFVNDEDLEQMAVNRAVDNGVLVSISAGNSNVFGDGKGLPQAKNPDYGVVGSPGLATDSLQVASIENTKVTGAGIEFKVNEENKIYPYSVAGPDILASFKDQELKIVDCGIGKPEEFTNAVKGNVALIKRGSLAFTDKILNAAAAGAKAVIISNNKGEEIINMQYPSDCNIPAIFVGQAAGDEMKANCNKEGFFAYVKGNVASAANPGAGSMSDFTSWGVTPDLELKPEITGVGGKVWSTANDNKYQAMSGTSMAAPNVSGGSALVLQRVDELFDLEGQARVEMAKNILMSTAVPHIDNGHLGVGNFQEEKGVVVAGKNYTSPRRQGAGVMNLAAATTTDAIVTDSSTGISKVNLKEIKGNKATFKINVQNFGDKELTYKLNGTVQTDLAEDVSLLQAQNIVDKDTNKFPISYSADTVKVPAKGNVEVSVTVDLTNAIASYNEKTIEEVFKNGGFVEGFVTLTDPEDNNPQLSIPYVGFKGEWGKASTIDSSIYNHDEQSFYESTAMMTPDKNEEGNYYYLGLPFDATKLEQANGNFIDFSPNGDGEHDTVVPMLSYLRNIKEMEVEILDSNSKVIRTLGKKENLRKNYLDNNPQEHPVRQFLNDCAWDGTANGKPVEDGTYTYRIRTKVDFEGAQWQEYDFKVNVDTQAPEVATYEVNDENKTLRVIATDNIKDHVYSYALITPMKDASGKNVVITNSDGKFDLAQLLDAGFTIEDCSIRVYDYAQNETVLDLGEPTQAVKGDKEAPVVKVASPEFFGILNNNDVVFEGTVQDASGIDFVTINGEKVDLKYSSLDKLWHFAHPMTLDNGYHSIYVDAKDKAGNQLGFAHKLFIDSEAPVVDIASVDPVVSGNKVTIKGNAHDNFPNLKVTINGDVIKNIEEEWEYFDSLKPANVDFAYDVNLVDGKNDITVEVSDGAGNTITQNVSVNKVDKLDVKFEKIAGLDRYKTAVGVSKKGWEKSNYAVLANGEAFVDALVAGPLASKYDAPILLTDKDKLTAETAEEMKRLGTEVVYVIGGTSVVSDNVVKELEASGIQVVRFGGANRYATSLQVAKYLQVNGEEDNVFIVNGEAVPDAVSISPKAALDKSPILLVEKNSVSSETMSWLKNKDKKFNAFFIGGTSVIEDSVIKEVQGITNTDVTGNRVSGINRYETNAAVIQKFYGKYMQDVMVTESEKLVDALVVAPYAARTSSPIVITDEALDKTQQEVLDNIISEKVTQIGGQVPSDIIVDIINRVQK